MLPVLNVQNMSWPLCACSCTFLACMVEWTWSTLCKPAKAVDCHTCSAEVRAAPASAKAACTAPSSCATCTSSRLRSAHTMECSRTSRECWLWSAACSARSAARRSCPPGTSAASVQPAQFMSRSAKVCPEPAWSAGFGTPRAQHAAPSLAPVHLGPLQPLSSLHTSHPGHAMCASGFFILCSWQGAPQPAKTADPAAPGRSTLAH